MLALVAVAVLAVPPQDSSVRLIPGGQEVVKVPGISRVALPNTEVADVRVTGPGELMVIGRQRGRVTMTMWFGSRVQTRNIIVDDGRTSDLSRLIRDTVSPGLTVEEYNGRTVVSGMLDSVDDMNRLQRVVGSDPNVTLLVELNPRVLPVVAQLITSALQREGLRDAKAVVVGRKIFLEGSVADQGEYQKAQLIADSIYSRSFGGY